MSNQIEQLRRDQQQLTTQLAQLPPPSCEFGPPVVSISGLPSELSAPNLLAESDAISARATVSSSEYVGVVNVGVSSGGVQ